MARLATCVFDVCKPHYFELDACRYVACGLYIGVLVVHIGLHSSCTIFLSCFPATAESGDSDSDDAGRGSQARREPVPALDDVGTDERPGQQPYDEVERVLGHRCVQLAAGIAPPGSA